MTGRERTEKVLAGVAGAGGFDPKPPILPIAHTALASLFGVALGDYYTDPVAMAEVAVRAAREFGFDGVQLTLGVTAEAHALGARIEQPRDAAPILREHLLAGDPPPPLDPLRGRDPASGGRMPVFFEAVARTAEAIGDAAFVLATLRGPLLIASQLRGVKQILMDTVEDPERTGRLLDFCVEIAGELGRRLRPSGAAGVVLGEATCSPNFIPPSLYRVLVAPRHRVLVRALKAAGWKAVGLHICGDTRPIIDDVAGTGADFLDIDHQVPAKAALAAARGRLALRGNLDPSSVFRFGSAERAAGETAALVRAVRGKRWILGSGCDIPPGTPRETIEAFVRAAREGS